MFKLNFNLINLKCNYWCKSQKDSRVPLQCLANSFLVLINNQKNRQKANVHTSVTEFLQSVRGQVFSSASFNAVTPSDLTHPSPFPLPFPSRVSVLLPLTFISLISDGESAIGPSRAPINSQLMSHFAAGWGLGERGGGAFYESIGIRRRLCVCEDGGGVGWVARCAGFYILVLKLSRGRSTLNCFNHIDFFSPPKLFFFFSFLRTNPACRYNMHNEPRSPARKWP